MERATAVVFALNPLKSTAAPALGEVGVVGVTDLVPFHAKVEPVVPDEVFLFLLVGRAELTTLSSARGVGIVPGLLASSLIDGTSWSDIGDCMICLWVMAGESSFLVRDVGR